MNSPATTSPCHPSSGKRPQGFVEEKSAIRAQAIRALTREHRSSASPEWNVPEKDMTKEQYGLLRQWYKDFAQPDVAQTLHDEQIIALATAVRFEPDFVISYVRKRRNSSAPKEHNADVEHITRNLSRSRGAAHPGPNADTVATANKHLPPTILPIVERYIFSCSRQRPQNDSRRSVNTGKYRCTFDCSYRTKRAFDWRRHEEIHEPQELWLCVICSQNDSFSPFLNSRKDKFLRHAADKHAELAAETLLDQSKLDFVSSAELDCRYCGEESRSWDDRCKHILGHFEDEVESSMKRVKVGKKDPEDDEGIASGEGSNVVTNAKSA